MDPDSDSLEKPDPDPQHFKKQIEKKILNYIPWFVLQAREKCPEIQLVQVPEVREKADLTKYRNAGREVIQVRKGMRAVADPHCFNADPDTDPGLMT